MLKLTLCVRQWFAFLLFLACPLIVFAGGQLPNGSPVSGSITNNGTTPIPTESWTFDGKAGEYALIAFTDTASPKNAFLCFNVYAPDGSRQGCNYGSNGFNALGQTGTYTIEVVWGTGAPSTVSYEMTLAEAGSSFTGNLVGNGSPTLGSLPNAGTIAEYTAYIPKGVSFFATVGTTTQSGGGMGMQITDPNGAQLLSGFYTDYNNVNSLTSIGGDYRFVLYGASGLTEIGYRFTVAVGGIPASLAGGEVISDGTYAGSMGHGVLDEWPFDTAAGQQVMVSIAAASGNPQGAGVAFDIFDPTGAKLFSGLTPNWKFTPATGGVYRIVIYRADVGRGAYFEDALYNLTLSGSSETCSLDIQSTANIASIARTDNSFSALNKTGHSCSCTAKDAAWIKAHLSDATTIANQLNVTPADILGLSALESGWGDSRFATEGKNFFGLQYPAPFSTGPPIPAGKPRANGTYAEEASFLSYLDSAKSFAQTYGSIVDNIADSTLFATALQNSGKFGVYDNGTKVPTYIHDMSRTINGLQSCLSK